MTTKIQIQRPLLGCALLAAACATPEDDVELRIVMHTPPTNELVSPDVEDPAEAVFVDVAEIRLRHADVDDVDDGAGDAARHESEDSPWHVVVPDRGDDKLYFGEENPLTLAHAILPPGEYDQLRLVVERALVFVDGEAHALEIPSGDTAGFKIHGTFCVPEHEAAATDGADDDRDDMPTLTLRWDTDEGLRHNDARGYWLVPSVHVEDAPGC